MNINKLHQIGSINVPPPVHSNAYAQVARGQRIGALAPVSFNQRLRIERGRTTVGRYHDSSVVQNRGEVRGITPGTSRPRTTSVAIPPRTEFKEPIRRGYNPYG